MHTSGNLGACANVLRIRTLRIDRQRFIGENKSHGLSWDIDVISALETFTSKSFCQKKLIDGDIFQSSQMLAKIISSVQKTYLSCENIFCQEVLLVLSFNSIPSRTGHSEGEKGGAGSR